MDRLGASRSTWESLLDPLGYLLGDPLGVPLGDRCRGGRPCGARKEYQGVMLGGSWVLVGSCMSGRVCQALVGARVAMVWQDLVGLPGRVW